MQRPTPAAASCSSSWSEGAPAPIQDRLRHGGVGCITATGNVNPAAIDKVYRNWQSAEADKLQAGITATRMAVQKLPMIPALKAIVAKFSDDPEWSTVRPPLIENTQVQLAGLFADLKALNFDMPGIKD